MSIMVPPEFKWHKDDMGWESYSDLPPILMAFQSLENGIRDGYPLCCVLEFAIDDLEGRLPFMRRGKVPDGNGGVYVPCSKCCEEMGREYIPSPKRWILIYCGMTIRETEYEDEAREWAAKDRYTSAFDRQHQQMYVG